MISIQTAWGTTSALQSRSNLVVILAGHLADHNLSASDTAREFDTRGIVGQCKRLESPFLIHLVDGFQCLGEWHIPIRGVKIEDVGLIPSPKRQD